MRLVTAALVLGLLSAVGAPKPDAALCGPVTPAEEAQREAEWGRALEQWLAGKPGGDARKALVGLADCLDVRVLQSAPDVATVRPDLPQGYLQGHLVYHAGGRWVVAPLESGGGTMEPYRAVTGPAKDRQLIASWTRPGTGVYGRVQLYRLGKRFEKLWESPEYEKFRLHILDSDWVTQVYRTPETWDEPHAIQANCCLPVDGQVLWQRQGNRFVQKGQRIVPNSYRAVSLFVGALKKGDRATALKWATGPDVVDAAAKVIGQINTSQWAMSDRGEAAEARWWDAIPPYLRGPKPEIGARLAWPSGPVYLVTEREEAGWKVAQVEPQ